MRMLYCPTRSPESRSKSIPGGYPQLVQYVCRVQDQKLPVRSALQIGRKPPRRISPEHLLGFRVAEASDHLRIVTQLVIIVERYRRTRRTRRPLTLGGRWSTENLPESCVEPTAAGHIKVSCPTLRVQSELRGYPALSPQRRLGSNYDARRCFELTGQLTPIPSAGLVDLVGRVSGTPPE